MGRLRFGVAFAVRVRNWKGIPLTLALSPREKGTKRLPRRGEETEEGNLEDAKVNYPVQGTPGSLINL